MTFDNTLLQLMDGDGGDDGDQTAEEIKQGNAKDDDLNLESVGDAPTPEEKEEL